MEGPVRLRLLFEDPNLLRGSQRRRGLQRCWYQLRPGVATIADLAFQLHQSFRLHRSCPHGLILTMDDFVLPSSESTRILKDEDAIIIKKKGVKFKTTSKICNGQNEEQVLESGRGLALNSNTLAVNLSHAESGDKEHMILPNVKVTGKKSNVIEMRVADQKKKHSDKLHGSDTLAIKDSQDDLQGDDEDVVLPNGNTEHMATPSSEIVNTVRKRKHSYKYEGSHSTLEIKDSERDLQGAEDDAALPNDKTTMMETPSESVNAKRRRKHSKLLRGLDTERDSQGHKDGVVLPIVNKVEIKSSSEMVNAKQRRKQSNQLQGSEIVAEEKDKGHPAVPDAHKDVKLRSRSARRKSAKRIWHRTHGLKKKMSKIQIAESDSPIKPTEQPIVDKNTDLDEEIVPVLVHSGHIRFESAEECSVPANGPVETLQWNGTTSKRKGQKWGREKNNKKRSGDDSYNWPVNNESNDKDPEPVKIFNEESEAMKEGVLAEQVETISEANRTKEIDVEKQQIDFESLLPLTRLPVEGDVLVYRLVELSSLWCPELSPFRIGMVSSYESSSSKIILHALPEYPLPSIETSDEGQENVSLYKEDGSLEIDFPSLIDVRLFEAHDLEEKMHKTSLSDTLQTPAPVNGQSATSGNNGIEPSSFHIENELMINQSWEEINKILSEKKAQLQKEYDLCKKSNGGTATRSWSYRSLRRNALGPTLALLRSTDDNTGE